MAVGAEEMAVTVEMRAAAERVAPEAAMVAMAGRVAMQGRMVETEAMVAPAASEVGPVAMAERHMAQGTRVAPAGPGARTSTTRRPATVDRVEWGAMGSTVPMEEQGEPEARAERTSVARVAMAATQQEPRRELVVRVAPVGRGAQTGRTVPTARHDSRRMQTLTGRHESWGASRT